MPAKKSAPKIKGTSQIVLMTLRIMLPVPMSLFGGDPSLTIRVLVGNGGIWNEGKNELGGSPWVWLWC